MHKPNALRLWFVLVGSLGLACNLEPAPNTPLQDAAEPVQAKPELAPEPAAPRSVVLQRGEAHRDEVREVFTDPRAEALMTLDESGGVRLWPTLEADAEALARESYSIPINEPRVLSLAKHGQAGFTLAFIDNSNTTSVFTLEPAAGATPAMLTERFVIAPEDPQLEVHVLDGGERILMLGVDHRVRLFDQTGKLLSTLDLRSFAPWQLRVVDGLGGPPKLAAVLAQPLRVQALALEGDTLSLRGEARSVELDRGPNLNDLQLHVDGHTVVALRRPRALGRDWSIELIDLDTDERKLLAGRFDTLVRPRLHIVDAERMLLETGSGRGYWVPFAEAVALAQPGDAHPDSRFADKLGKRSSHASIRLPASAEDADLMPDGDIGVRMHASVQAGVRVNVDLRGDREIVVDRLDESADVELLHPRLATRFVALTGDASHVVWANNEALTVQQLDGEPVERSFPHDIEEPFVLDALDAQHGLLVGRRSAALFDLKSGVVTATAKVELDWDIAAVDIQRRDDAWLMAYTERKPAAPVRLLESRNGTLLDTRPLADAERSAWPGLIKPSNADEYAQSGATTFYTLSDPRTRLHVANGSEQRIIELPAGQGRALAPSPDGKLLAIAQFRWRAKNRFNRSRSGGQDLVLSVIDVASGERLWTRAVFSESQLTVKFAWSQDGRALASVAGGVGTVYDASTGARRLERARGPVELRARETAE
jgi:hypothetical protein